LAKTVKEFDGGHFDSATIRAHAERFGEERFRREMREFIEAKWAEHLRR